LSGAIGRAYVLGSEMFGAIYVAFGKEKVFKTMKNPRRLFSLYNPPGCETGRARRLRARSGTGREAGRRHRHPSIAAVNFV
jgi:hypothetical protein